MNIIAISIIVHDYYIYAAFMHFYCVFAWLDEDKPVLLIDSYE